MLKNLRKKMNEKKKKKGFTLIELIIVIAIIAILAAIALPKFSAYRQRANYNSDLANGKTIQSAVTSLIAEDKIKLGGTDGTKPYLIDLSGTYTGTVGTLALPAKTDIDATSTVADYLQSTPTPKFTGTKFLAAITADGTVTVYIDLVANQVTPKPAGTHDASKVK